MTKFSKHFYLRLEPELFDAIETEAEARGKEMRPAMLVREALRDTFLPKKRLKKQAKKKPKKRVLATEIEQVVEAVYQIWDDEMPPHISRPTMRNDARDGKIMGLYAKISDLELWRYGIKAVSLDPWSMGNHPQNRTWTAKFDWFISPGRGKVAPPFFTWVEAGEELKKHGVPTSKHAAGAEFLEGMRQAKLRLEANDE